MILPTINGHRSNCLAGSARSLPLYGHEPTMIAKGPKNAPRKEVTLPPVLVRNLLTVRSREPLPSRGCGIFQRWFSRFYVDEFE